MKTSDRSFNRLDRYSDLSPHQQAMTTHRLGLFFDTQDWMVGRYEECVRHPATTDFSHKHLGEPGAWDKVLELRVGDLPIATLFRYNGEEYRRIESSGKARHLAIRPVDAARGFADPMYVVEPDRAMAYLKRVPIGARFGLLAYEGGCRTYTKAEGIDAGRRLVAVIADDGSTSFLPGNLVVVVDHHQIDE